MTSRSDISNSADGASISITDLKYWTAPDSPLSGGLLGFVEFTINSAIVLRGIALRRTRNGRLVLSFPERRDRRGRTYDLVRPAHDAARREIQQQVFAALGLDDEGPAA